jgi:hypothetical protein
METETPARNRKSGALIPAISWPYQYASIVRQGGAVHESIVCASIMMTTARPRSQSTYPRRGRGELAEDVAVTAADRYRD